MDNATIERTIASLSGEVKEQVSSLYARLKVCEAAVGGDIDADICDQIRKLFTRLEAAESQLMQKLGGSSKMLQVLKRVQCVEGIIRERDLEATAEAKEVAMSSTQESPLIPLVNIKDESKAPTLPVVKEITAPQASSCEKVIAPATQRAEHEPIQHLASPKLRPIHDTPSRPKEEEEIPAMKSEITEDMHRYTMAQLVTGSSFPSGVDPSNREKYLSDDDFKQVLGLTRTDFNALPKWKRDSIKKRVGLF